MTAKHALYWSKIRKRKRERVLKRQIRTKLKKRIKELISYDGSTEIKLYFDITDPLWKYVPYVASWLEKKGYKCSYEVLDQLDKDYRIIVSWGEEEEHPF
jgi:hypothetical protein